MWRNGKVDRALDCQSRDPLVKNFICFHGQQSFSSSNDDNISTSNSWEGGGGLSPCSLFLALREVTQSAKRVHRDIFVKDHIIFVGYLET